METVVIVIMLLVCFGFVLRLTCMGWRARIAVCAVAAGFILLTCDLAAAQSKTQISDWLTRPELMLDASVLLTADVAFQICFCVLAAKAMAGGVPKFCHHVLLVCRYVPGLLIFPVLFALLTALIFALPGADFASIARAAGLGVLAAGPLVAACLLRLVPEPDIRLELIFMISLLVGALGVVATVNGRTAAAGTGCVEWGALAGVAVIMTAGFAGGMLLNKITISKKISKLSK